MVYDPKSINLLAFKRGKIILFLNGLLEEIPADYITAVHIVIIILYLDKY